MPLSVALTQAPSGCPISSALLAQSIPPATNPAVSDQFQPEDAAPFKSFKFAPSAPSTTFFQAANSADHTGEADGNGNGDSGDRKKLNRRQFEETEFRSAKNRFMDLAIKSVSYTPAQHIQELKNALNGFSKKPEDGKMVSFAAKIATLEFTLDLCELLLTDKKFSPDIGPYCSTIGKVIEMGFNATARLEQNLIANKAIFPDVAMTITDIYAIYMRYTYAKIAKGPNPKLVERARLAILLLHAAEIEKRYKQLITEEDHTYEKHASYERYIKELFKKHTLPEKYTQWAMDQLRRRFEKLAGFISPLRKERPSAQARKGIAEVLISTIREATTGMHILAPDIYSALINALQVNGFDNLAEHYVKRRHLSCARVILR